MKKFLRSLLVGLTIFASSVAHAGALSDFLENKLADHIFRAASYTKPTNLYVGLLTSACSDSSGGVEVSGGSYARVINNPGDATWKSTNGATSGNSSGTSGTVSNAVVLTFPAPTGNWGTVTGWAVYDASTAGNMLVCATLTTSKNINSGDAAPSFAVDALTVQLDS